MLDSAAGGGTDAGTDVGRAVAAQPPKVNLGPANGTVVAFDVGGTAVKAALIHPDGKMSPVRRIPTPVAGKDTPALLVDLIERTIHDFSQELAGSDRCAAAVVVPGIVDEEEGTGVLAHNLGWSNVPFRPIFEQRLQMPVYFGHDVRAAGLAEYRLGAASGYENAVIIALGTGIAAALFVDGRICVARGRAGEIGHLRVAAHTACACGATGCLEAISSAAAIVRRYNARSGSPVTGADEVVKRLKNGDRSAEVVWREAVDALAEAIVQISALIGPEVMVLGGGLAESGSDLFHPLNDALSVLGATSLPLVLPASLGEDAGVIGAAIAGRRKL
ncbi:ROK family protein [Arthrobacter sp. KN11-1C]|uniref:ROK family protein n=1 Tax=Arthrobacter sp. KN11-1C TaxID=3445774 RepID=UPI003F9F5916